MRSGTVIATHGRHHVILSDGATIQCVTRGKKTDIAVGDHVNFVPTSSNQGVIESTDERQTLLYRSDQYKSKFLAANVSQVMIVTATEPVFYDDLLSRALVAANAAGIKAHIILNKIDVSDHLSKTRSRLKIYGDLGYPIHEVSALTQSQATFDYLSPLLSNQSTLLIGQSGMGKSSLINVLIPNADIATREISTALGTGKHTTTFTRLYHIDEHTNIIDSPGFQEFGLYHLSEGMLERAFVEFSPYLGKCKFYNCHHVKEPGCSILEHVQSGQITADRHALYLQLMHESAQKPLPKRGYKPLSG